MRVRKVANFNTGFYERCLGCNDSDWLHVGRPVLRRGWPLVGTPVASGMTRKLTCLGNLSGRA
jgi:hypothetical protein